MTRCYAVVQDTTLRFPVWRAVACKVLAQGIVAGVPVRIVEAESALDDVIVPKLVHVDRTFDTEVQARDAARTMREDPSPDYAHRLVLDWTLSALEAPRRTA